MLYVRHRWQELEEEASEVVEFTLCSYGLMNVINYRVRSRDKMGRENLCNGIYKGASTLRSQINCGS